MKRYALFFLFGFSLVPTILFAQTVSLQDKIDQLFIIGFRGATLKTAPELSRALTETNLGGVILFDYDTSTKKYNRNIAGLLQTKTLITEIQKNARTPLFVSIDEEGGAVSRLKRIHGFSKTPSASSLGVQSDTVVQQTGQFLGGQLKMLGFNLDFAPVLDVAVNPKSPAIGKVGRAFSSDETVAAQKAIVFANGLAATGIIAVGKHYPGHGSAVTDSHLGFTDISKTYSINEQKPFRDACGSNVPMIMVGHLYDKNIDPNFPATLSAIHIKKLKEVGCNTQLIVSDDMDMGALTKNYSRENSLVRALSAGIDVLILSNNITTYAPDEYFIARKIIFDAVQSGKISQARIDEAYQKVLELKKQYKII